MSKKVVLMPALLMLVVFCACGPAAEDRHQMHDRAKVFQDSIAGVIRATIAEAEGPAPVMAPAPQPTAAPTPTTK